MITLIITTILLAIYIVTTILIKEHKKSSDNFLSNRSNEKTIDRLRDWQMFSSIFGVIGALLFICAFGLIRLDTHAFIEKKHSIENTIQHSSSNEIENAAMIQNVINYNQLLRTRKYYANTWSFAIYHPDDIHSVEPINLDSLSRKD